MAIEISGMTPLLQVFDMPRSLAFYRDVLGFEVVSDSGKGDDSSWVWLRLTWITSLVLLYPLCYWYGNLKRRSGHWVFSYL